MNLNIIYVILLILFVFMFIVIKLNNYLIFKPYVPSDEEYENALSNNIIEIDNLMISTKNGRYINAMWLNKNNNKYVTLYAHGNSGWCGNLINSKIIHILLKYSSVVIFDYAGYGFSQGSPSENNTYIDISTIYDYLLKQQSLKANNIIVYGFSLGTGIATKLVSECNNENSPKLLILDAPYISIKEIGNDINPLLKHFILINYDNDKNIRQILDNKINTKIIILHSKNDEVINYKHGKKLSKKFDIKIYKLSGSHNKPRYGTKLKKIFMSLHI